MKKEPKSRKKYVYPQECPYCKGKWDARLKQPRQCVYCKRYLVGPKAKKKRG
jgi:hypothetical protein